MLIGLALALRGVGYPSMFLALRGHVVVGLGGGKACPGDVAVSSGAVGAVSVSAGAVGASEVSGALNASQSVSGATMNDAAVSGATAGDEAPEC